MTVEDLKQKTVEELKALCKDLGLRNYSDLTEDALIEKLLASGKIENNSEEQEVENKLNFEAKRSVSTKSLGDVKGKFSLTKEQFDKDIKLQKAIKHGFVVKV